MKQQPHELCRPIQALRFIHIKQKPSLSNEGFK